MAKLYLGARMAKFNTDLPLWFCENCVRKPQGNGNFTTKPCTSPRLRDTAGLIVRVLALGTRILCLAVFVDQIGSRFRALFGMMPAMSPRWACQDLNGAVLIAVGR